MLWLLVGWTLAASAGPVSWDGVVDTAIDAWSVAEGASLQAELDGARRARRVAATPLSVAGGTRLGARTNQEAFATLQAPLGLGVLARRSWTTRTDALHAEAAVDRQAFVERVLDAWSAWWMARELALHLDAWSVEVKATLAPLDDAVREGLAAPLDAEDLRAELATVRAEAAAARADAIRAEAHLRALLGADPALDGGERHLHDLDVADLDNPWTPLVAQAADAPDVRAAEARADALHAQGRALGAWRPTLEVGVAFADGIGPFEALGVVGIQAPLRPPGLAEARQAQAQATAERRRAAWRTERIAGAWRAEAAGFDAAQDRITRLDREVVAPLARRLERLEAAFGDGLVPADRVIRARRDHHEAEHERLVLTARLVASSARAEAVRRMLETA